MNQQRLLTKEGILKYLGGINSGTYENWRKRGIVAGPVPGTNRYDVKAHDKIIDRIQGIESKSGETQLEEWLRNESKN